MTCSSPSSSFGKKDKYVTWIKNSFRTLVEFRKYVKQMKMGQILTINYAYEEKQKRQFLIIGKVVALPPKLPNNRKVISAKTVPATTLHIKELISDNDTLVFRKIFKVKFVGKIASDIESAGIHIGDRIVLVNPLIAENTDYLPSPHIDPLTALMFDDSFGLPASVLLSPKIPPGAEFPKNKLLARLRCSTPVSDGRSELEVSESEGIENKAKSSKMNKIGKRNIFEKHSRQISPKKNIPIKPGYRRLTNDQCIHPALNDITVYDNERISPKKGKVQQRLNSSPVKSPAKQLSNVDLNDDISILEPCEGTSRNINDDMINSIVQFNKRESVQHDFIKIKDISEKHVNKNVNMFVIVLDVRQNEIEGKKKNCLIARVIDETCPKFKPFTVYMFYEDRKPKVEPKWILRIRHVKIECYKGVYDGRIFSAGSVVSFRPRCSGLEFEEPITLRKEPYESNDFDMNIVDNLRKFIIGKHWNLLVMLGGFYPTPPANIKQVTLEGITDETWFSLKCEINHVRIFFDFNIIVLTISDGTVLPHFSYRAPKDCKLWSEALSSREQYFSDQNQIDIIMKNVDPTFDHKILQENTEVLINNIQILRNKYKNLDALIFVLDASFPKSKIDVLPSLTNFKDFSETQEESNVISMSDEVGKKKTTTPSKLCQEKVKAVSSHVNDGSKNDDEVEIIVNERKEKEVNNDFSKPVLQKKKLFYVDSSNIDAYFSSSENTGDCFKNSKTKKSKCCSVVLNVIPESSSSTKNESNTALNDGSISDKNNLNSAEKIENFESCSKKRKIASGSDELPRINSSDFTNSEEKENVQSDGITSKELLVEKPNDASDNVYNHSRRSISPDNGKDVEPQEDQGNKIHHNSSSFWANIKKKGIKIPPNLYNLNLLPIILIKRIDDTLDDKKISVESSDTNTSFSVSISTPKGKNLEFSNSDSLTVSQSCNQMFRKSNRIMKRRKHNSGENYLYSSTPTFSKRSPYRNINTKVNVLKKRKIHFENDNLSNEENIISSSMNNNEEMEKEGNSITLKNEADIANSLSSSDCGYSDLSRLVKNSNSNRVIKIRKRKSSSQRKYCNKRKIEQQHSEKITSQDEEETDHNKNSEKPKTLNESSKMITYNCENCPSVCEDAQHEFFNENGQVNKKLSKPGKRRKKRGIEEIAQSLSESHLKLSSSSCECHTRVHKFNADDSQSDMEFTIIDGNSLRSDCSDHINTPTPVLNRDNYINRKTFFDGNITDFNQFDIKECSRLNCVSERTSPQLMRVYTATRKVLKTDEIKSSLKNKILARSCSANKSEDNYSKEFNNNNNLSSSVSPGSFKTVENLFDHERILTTRKPVCSDGCNESNMKKIEEWLQRMETDGPSNIDELHNACDMHDEIHQNKETRCDYNESKEMESQSQIISEFVKPETKGNPILSRQLPTVVVKKQLSYKVLMWDLQPKLTDDPLDIVSGLCETSCENFFLYSTLKYTSELTPICPLCFREGKEVAVKLNFLFELLLVLQTGHSITALVYGNHATKLLGCTVEEYLQNSNVRQQTIQLLHHYLGAGHNLSMRYTPPFLAQLVPISLTPPNQPSVVRFCVINTELPPVNSERILSTFIDTT